MGATSEMFLHMQDEIMNTVHKAEEGELSNLDALIELRQKRAELEKGIEIIKSFEEEHINEIAREAESYPEGYRGYEVKAVSGRKTFSFKGINEIESIDSQKKQIEEKYKSAFEGFQKGVVQVTRINEDDPDSPLGWIDENGEIKPFPEVNFSKSYLTVKEKRK